MGGRFLGAFLIAQLASGCAEGGGAGVPATYAEPRTGVLAGRSVVIVLVDSLHSAHLGCYGAERETSPVLDALAERMVRFEAAYSPSSWTLPSVTSLFTSLEQERHGMRRMSRVLPEGIETMAELFRERGYRTEALIQNGVVDERTGLDRGFDQYNAISPTYPGATRKMIEQVRYRLQRESEEPTLLYVHLFAPHQPYEAPEPLRDLWVDEAYDGTVTGTLEDCARIAHDRLAPDHPDVEQLSALYDGYVRYVDGVIGAMLGGVINGDGGRDWAFVVTSDHGEAFMQHRCVGHGFQVYEEQVRVPLLFAAPGAGFEPGSVIAEPVSLLDVLPTFVECFGLEPPAHPMRGRSLLPLLKGEVLGERALFLTARFSGKSMERPQRAVRRGRHKLVRRKGHDELYDLEADPGEEVDLSSELPALARSLSADLDTWIAEAHEDWVESESEELSEETLRALEAIGYAGDE